jgi:RimJ/RimL family protein N-acetyltransferase
MTAVLANAPVLATDRLVLRAPVMADLDHWLAFAASPRAQYIGGPYDLGKGWRAFAHVAGMWALRGYGSFIFCLQGTNTPIGMSGPWHPADWPEREIGWTVWDTAAEGQGYAYEAAQATRAFAYRTLGWDGAVSYIDPANVRSIVLAERLGAVLDPAAAKPGGPEDDTLVYRHPTPEAAL